MEISIEAYEGFALVLKYILIIVAGLGGSGAVIEFAKKTLPLGGWKTNVVAATVSVLFGIMIGIVDGALVQESFSWAATGQTALIVFTLSRVQFEAWQRKYGPPAVNVTVVGSTGELPTGYDNLSAGAADIQGFIAGVWASNLVENEVFEELSPTPLEPYER